MNNPTLQDLVEVLVENQKQCNIGEPFPSASTVTIMATSDGNVTFSTPSFVRTSVGSIIGDIQAETRRAVIAKQSTVEGKKAHREKLLEELNALNAELVGE